MFSSDFLPNALRPNAVPVLLTFCGHDATRVAWLISYRLGRAGESFGYPGNQRVAWATVQGGSAAVMIYAEVSPDHANEIERLVGSGELAEEIRAAACPSGSDPDAMDVHLHVSRPEPLLFDRPAFSDSYRHEIVSFETPDRGLGLAATLDAFAENLKGHCIAQHTGMCCLDDSGFQRYRHSFRLFSPVQPGLTRDQERAALRERLAGMLRKLCGDVEAVTDSIRVEAVDPGAVLPSADLSGALAGTPAGGFATMTVHSRSHPRLAAAVAGYLSRAPLEVGVPAKARRSLVRHDVRTLGGRTVVMITMACRQAGDLDALESVRDGLQAHLEQQLGLSRLHVPHVALRGSEEPPWALRAGRLLRGFALERQVDEAGQVEALAAALPRGGDGPGGLAGPCRPGEAELLSLDAWASRSGMSTICIVLSIDPTYDSVQEVERRVGAVAAASDGRLRWGSRRAVQPGPSKLARGR